MNLNKELNKLEDMLFDADMNEWYEAVKAVRMRLKEAEKVIEFYACVANPIVGDNEQVKGTEDMDNYYEHGGKRARAYLEKYRGEK